MENGSSRILGRTGLGVALLLVGGLATTAVAQSSGDFSTLVESSLSAHSFNFYVSNLTPGTHTVGVSWDVIGGRAGEGVCVGPGTLTVQQVKNFSFDTGIGL